MKKYLIILAAIFTGFNSFAQDPQLLENDWYLQKVTVDGEDFFSLSPNRLIIELNFDVNSFTKTYITCNSAAWSSWNTIIDYDTNNFTLDNELYGISDGGCAPDPDANAFSLIHSEIYYIDNIPINPFAYIITPSGSYLQLTITNANGDIAIYGNELLSNQAFEITDFTIYPNPVKNILQINTQNSIVIKNIQVYNIMGKKLMETKNSNQIDVSTLASGLLFVKIETNKGFVVKKVVKK